LVALMRLTLCRFLARTFCRFVPCVLVACSSALAHSDASTELITLSDLTGLTGVSARGIQFSPDGDQLAYEDSKERLFLIAAKSGSKPRRIAEGSTPTWSPSGRLLAYYKGAGVGHRQLWVYDLSRRAARQVTKFAGGIDPDFRMSYLFPEALDFAWSPDSRSIVFGSRMDALGFNSAGKDILDRLHEKPAEVAPSDVGKPIVFTNSTPYGGTLAGILPGWRMPPPEVNRINQLYVVNVDDGKIRSVTHGPDGCATPDWSPDGKSIVCTSLEAREADGYGPPITNIYVVDPVTGARAAVTSGENQKLNPRWSPNGQYIAYIEIVGGHAFGGMPLISVVGRSGGPVMRIPDENTQRYDGRRLFQWLADG
jgi:Tol biopolymer transport system component